MTNPALPLIEFHYPATFRSRGVATPFTTPLLAGARVREAKCVELVVPDPSGGLGVYIVQWPGVRELCQPTVHDTILYKHVSRLPGISPASVRDVALDVANDGYAGPAAAAAAAATSNRDRAQRSQAYVLLSAQLLNQVDPDSQQPKLPGDRRHAGGPATTAWYRIAPLIGCSVNVLETALTGMSQAFAAIGVAQDDQKARVPQLLNRLSETYRSLTLWLDEDPGNDIGGLGQPLAATIKAACDAGEAILSATRAALANPKLLLMRWLDNPEHVLASAARCDWLLDGWERVCLLWLVAASTASRRASLLEMAQLLPALPSEIESWTEMPAQDQALHQACRVTSHNDAWRTGSAAFALIHRNETFRAMSL